MDKFLNLMTEAKLIPDIGITIKKTLKKRKKSLL